MTNAYIIKVIEVDTYRTMVDHYKRLGYKVETVCTACGDLIIKVCEEPKAIPVITDDLIFEV